MCQLHIRSHLQRKEFIFEDANISLLITSSQFALRERLGFEYSCAIDDAGIYTGEDTNPE